MFANENRLARLLRKAGRLPPRSSLALVARVALKAHRAEGDLEREAEAAAAAGVVTEVDEGVVLQEGPELWGEAASTEGVPYWLQADPSLHSAAMLKKRFALRHHSLVLAPLHAWWVAAMHTLTIEQAPKQANGQHCIAYDGYRAIYHRIFRAMMADFDPSEADAILDDDWKHDCPAGATALPRETFQDAIFQLADVWTAGVDPEEYAAFLWTLLDRIAAKATCGCPGLCSDRIDGGGTEDGRWARASGGRVAKGKMSAGGGGPAFKLRPPETIHYCAEYAADEDADEDADEEGAAQGSQARPVPGPARQPPVRPWASGRARGPPPHI